MVNMKAQLLSLLALATLTAAAPASENINPLQPRAVDCRDDLGESSLARASEAAECINYLASLGAQACVASVSGTSFCRRGQTQITGLSLLGGGDSTRSSCQNVARGAGQIMDLCTRGDGTVRGQTPAWGNGNMIVDIRRVP
ncbi:hypothetical protein MFIFM68171_00324 [Madurella fahalii]|uniref:Uncharacterized protein n=1 Tax=Madurella fahalii TaxID=1157608 RepID=A0ABQ0FX90_9PEZI